MADDFGDKTEAPTPKRRQEAREQGNIARSTDLTATVLFLTGLLLLKSYGTELVGAMKGLFEEMLGQASMSDLDPNHALMGFLRALVRVAAALAPILIGVVVVAVLINIVQVGLGIHTKRITPNLAALNPVNGFSRLFSMKNRTPGGALITVLKLIAVCLASYSSIHGGMEQIVSVQEMEFLSIFVLGSQMIFSIALRIAIVLLVIAIIDYGYQKWRIEKQLKMSKQEIKEEMRRMEADPQIKQKRKQIAYQQMKQRMEKDVPRADVVVTNPTHIAIALRYDAEQMHAPRVVAKGQGFIAQRIREIAIANGVPILERKPLARALYKLVEVGQEIPEQFYSTVAEILAYVYELTGKTAPNRVPVGV